MSRTLKPKPLTAEGFTPFGDVIEAAGEPLVINYGASLRFHDLAAIDTQGAEGRPIISVFRSSPPPYPFALRVMENHPVGSQAFMPLSGRPYLVVVAPAGPFEADALHAFVAGPLQGVNYRKGVWHHYSLALGAVSDFLVIDREGPGDNLEEIALDGSILLAAPG
ncbi:MAG TPA: ureidoglycolate lyase [Rhizomicrobium sp.]|jgi:ureidoglycolate lyase|nr:ureidoglycolate lyase [Rhizomicrobium sp.]